MPRALIAEDEPLLRDELVELLAQVWPQLEICAAVADGNSALEAIATKRPDVAFLDVEMPGLSGIEVARQMPHPCHVAFITAYEHYAVSAFENGAVDYVLKPLSATRLSTTVSRLQQRLVQPPVNIESLLEQIALRAHAARDYLRWINVSVGTSVRLVTVDEICYFQADNKYTVLMTDQAESLINMTIRELLEALDPHVFWQIHRSTIVNVNAISDVKRDLRGRLSVKLKSRPEALPVSQPYACRFRHM